jgi:hypothetical protein
MAFRTEQQAQEHCPKGHRRLGRSSKRRLSSQHEPVLRPCRSGPLRLPPRSGAGGHACNGELIRLARAEISRNRMVSFGFERIFVAARCQAIGCFLRLLRRRPAKAFGVVSPKLLLPWRDFAAQAQVHRCYLAANKRKQQAPIERSRHGATRNQRR